MLFHGTSRSHFAYPPTWASHLLINPLVHDCTNSPAQKPPQLSVSYWVSPVLTNKPILGQTEILPIEHDGLYFSCVYTFADIASSTRRFSCFLRSRSCPPFTQPAPAHLLHYSGFFLKHTETPLYSAPPGHRSVASDPFFSASAVCAVQ